MSQALGRFKPYPEYKDSGMEWLGRIPDHWRVARLRNIASTKLSNVDKKTTEGELPTKLCNYTDVYYNNRISKSINFMIASATRAQVIRFSLRRNDVLITKDSESWTDIAVPAVVEEDLPDVLCGYHLALIRPDRRHLHGPFLAYACSAIGPRDQFQIAANGITRFGLTGDSIRAAVFMLPPIAEQIIIAEFLNHETEKIDALIAKKKRLIELLQEKRTALITHAVTKGFSPHIPIQETRSVWLGNIPSHWKVQPLKNLTPGSRPIMYGIVLPGPNVLDGVPIVKGGDVTPDKLRSCLLNRTTYEIETRHARSRLKRGDIVFAIRGSVGSSVLVPAELEEANLTQDVARVAAREDVYGPWLLFALQSRAVLAQLEAGLGGAAVKGINIYDLKRTIVPVPSAGEQKAIAELLQVQTMKADILLERIANAIDSLIEYRSTIVVAAVTGKIDLRGEFVDENC